MDDLRACAARVFFRRSLHALACIMGPSVNKGEGGAGAMDTKLLHLSQVPISTGLPESLHDPIKPDLFRGFHEGRLGAQAGVAQFGVHHGTPWRPGPPPRRAS